MFKNFFSLFKNKDVEIKEKKKILKEREIIFDDIAFKVLDNNQKKLKSLLEDFSTTHFLAGGTAIALYLGHRKSIDFDFFSPNSAGSFADFVKRISKRSFDVSVDDKKNFSGVEFIDQDEIHVSINLVRFSLINFFRTVYNNQKILIKGDNYILGGLRIATLEELAVMKLFAMISRKKWKDAVDIYFIIHKLNQTLEELLFIAETKYFINIFNKEAVLEQLISKSWDKTENVEYLIETPPKDKEIEDFLEKEAIKIIEKSSFLT